ncbi:MAG: MotA/TolQ/ExbB proton channel family protein [Deltaproteobacteria bacterium]|nr:MotA/TolQ/ExbB proton channel family protein [Deltaproteobacteria bacterium]
MISYISESAAFLSKGGIVMIPIIICSLIGFAVFVERLLALKRDKIIPADLFEETKVLILDHKINEALELCNANGSSLARILRVGIKNYGRSREAVKEVIEEVGRREVAFLDKYTGIMGTVANITPLLGLLGTVSGMIKAFNLISSVGVGDPAVLAGGISEALITTASGLTVAIPTFVGYKFLLSKADILVIEMEEFSTDVVELLKGEEEENLKSRGRTADRPGSS